MKILIATGIYPPATSGPAQYAAAMEDEFKARGNSVTVATFSIEHKLPTGLRHVVYFFKILKSAYCADFILALDTFSTGFPAVLAGKLFGTPVLLRTGGDFLYEQYVERTNEPIVLSQFYLAPKLNKKEKIILKIIRWTLQNVSALIFSTEWQRDIFMKPYALKKQRIFVVQNRFDKKISNLPATQKNFIFATRNIAYKNISNFKKAFIAAQKKYPEITLEIIHDMPHEKLMEKMKTCYVVVMPSLGEISPHVILDAVRVNKPFILTRESGYAALFQDVGILVDPQDCVSMQQGIEFLAEDTAYEAAVLKVQNFNVIHTWRQIADEILDIYKKISV